MFNLSNISFQKNKYFKFLNRKIIVFLVFLLLGITYQTTVFALWDGLPFSPGTQDNPPCLPSQINCDVIAPLTSELDPIFVASKAFTITGLDISNWNGKQSALGFTPVSNTTTINGQALTSDIVLNASDFGLGNVTNESKATMFASPVLTGTISVNGNINMTGSIIPSLNDTYALGSPSKVWKDLYVGAGSIYVNGQKVLQTDPSNSVLVSADVSQNLILQTTGGGNVELNPASGGGQVLLKSNIVLTAGKTIRSSDLSSIIFSDGTTSGNIQISGNAISSSNLNGGISISPNGLGNTYVTNGNFGVGTTSGLSKLSINGGLHVGGDSDAGDNNILADGTITGANLSGTNTGDNATNSQYSLLITSKQDALNGAGLVRVSGGTVTYDNTNYVSGTPWTSLGYVTGTPWTSLGYVTGTPWTSAGYITDGNTNWDNIYGFITGYTETDPTFTASSSAGITGTNISNWNQAYGWGNHANAGYLTSANIAGLIPYTGGNSNVDLGIHNLTVDTNSLFVDSVNHRVGVGTTSPGASLEIGSIASGGNVKIQATESAEKITIPIVSGGWALGTGYTINTGILSRVSSAVTSTSTVSSGMTTVTAGRTYKVSFDITAVSGDSSYISLGGVTMGIGSSVKHFEEYIIAGSTVKLGFNVTYATSTFTIENISVKELIDGTGDLTVYGKLKPKGQMLMGWAGANPAYSFASGPTAGMNYNAGSGWITMGIGTMNLALSGDGVAVNVPNGYFNVGNTTGFFSPANGTLEQRGIYGSTVNPQTYNLYAGWTSASNYVNRLRLSAAAGSVGLTAESAGATGDVNTNIVLTPKGSGYTLLNGNVGIGTTSPQRLLDITSNSGNPQLRLTYDSTHYADIKSVSDGSIYFQPSVGRTYFNGVGVNNSFYAYDYSNAYNTYLSLSAHNLDLNSNLNDPTKGQVHLVDSGNSYLTGGNVGIGTTTPGATLDVLSSTATSGTLGQFVNSNPSGGNQTLLNIAFTGNGVGYSGTALNINTGKMIGGSALQINAGINSGQFQLASGNLVGVTYNGTYLGTAGSYNQAGNLYSISRTNIGNGGVTGNTLTINGAVATISDNATVSSGLLVSTADVLDLTQNYTGNTGTVLKVIQNGTGPSATFSGGNVGIGNINPVNKLDVDGVISSDLGFNITTVSAPTVLTLALVSDSVSTHISIGQYYYIVTYITAIGETNPSSPIGIITDSNNRSVQISNIPISTNAKVIGRKIYRTGVNQTSDRGSLLVTINDNTTTSYLDIKADSALGPNSWANYRPNTTSKYISVNGNRSLLLDPHSTFIGYQAGFSANETPFSTFVGNAAGYAVTSGQSNVFVGDTAGRYTTTGGGNIAIGGYLSLYSNSIGSGNISIGDQALRYSTSGSYNIGLGNGSGGKILTSQGNMFLGISSGSLYAQFPNANYSTAIGYNSYTTKNNQTVIGGDSLSSGNNLETIINGDTFIKKESSVGSENLTNGTLTAGTSWIRTNDCALSSDTAVCTYSSGAISTITQTGASFATAIKGGHWYKFVYTVSGVTGTPTATITSAIANISTNLYVGTNGTFGNYFYSNSSPTDFVISTTLTSGQSFTLDTLSLKEVNGGNLLVNGNVGIGTTNPTHLLTMGVGGGFYDETTGAWIDGSDRNYKDNILSLDKYGLNTLNSLRPVSYNFKHSGVAQIGFIAQEVKLLIPELVSGEEGSMGLNYGGFSPLIVKSIQELDLKLEGIAMPVDIITNRTFAERFYDKLIAWLGSKENGLERICVKKADGTSFCADGDQLEKAVNGLSGGTVAPVAEVKKEPVPPIVPPAPIDPAVVTESDPIIEPDPTIPPVIVPALIDSVVEPGTTVAPEVKAIITEPIDSTTPVIEKNI
jgi:hypothetical protein